MWPAKKRRSTEEPATLTRKVSLGDLADKRRPLTTYVERPDQYTALPHAAAAEPVDRDAALEQVRAQVRELLPRAVDEYDADTMDAEIDQMRAGWDQATAVESAQRAGTLRQLRAMELGDLTRIQAKVAELRETVAELRSSVAAWKAVLRGSPVYDPDAFTTGTGDPTACRPVDLTVVITAADAPAAPSPTFDPTDALLAQLQKEALR